MVTSVARNTLFMLYPLLNKSTISYLMSSGKDFLAQEIFPTDVGPLYLVGLNSTSRISVRSFKVPAELSSEDSDFTSNFRVSAR